MSSSKIIRLAVRRHLFLAALILLSTAVSVITSLIPPVILGRIVDRLSRAQNISLLMIFSYFGLILISGVFESGRESLLVIFGQKVTHTLRSALCAKLERLPADCFVKTQPGVTASRFVGDVDTVEELFTSALPPPASSAMSIRWKSFLLPASSACSRICARSSVCLS